VALSLHLLSACRWVCRTEFSCNNFFQSYAPLFISVIIFLALSPHLLSCGFLSILHRWSGYFQCNKILWCHYLICFQYILYNETMIVKLLNEYEDCNKLCKIHVTRGSGAISVLWTQSSYNSVIFHWQLWYFTFSYITLATVIFWNQQNSIGSCDILNSVIFHWQMWYIKFSHIALAAVIF
jgi:hypothetical protein